MSPTPKNLHNVRAIATAVALVILASFLQPSCAQAASPGSGVSGDNKEASTSNEPTPAGDTGLKLEEVTVTAQRYEQNLQDVPISVTAFSAEDIAAKSTSGLQEFAQFVPNLTFTNHGTSGSSGNVVFMRGIGQVEPGIEFNPGVGVYLDGIYLGVMRGLDLDLIDVERMEILRGPQGTLFGKNTVGGAINVISKKPGNEFGATVEVTTGRFDRLDAKGSVNVPIIANKLAARFAVASRNRDGYARRLDFASGAQTGEMGDVSDLSGRAMIDWTPTENLDVLVSIDGLRSRAHANPWTLIATGQPPAITAVLNPTVDPDWGDIFLTGNDFTSYATGPNTNDTDVRGTSAIVTWGLGNWTVKSLTSYREVETLFLVDADAGPYILLHSHQRTQQDQFSQELLLTGSSFKDRLTSVLGVFYFDATGASDRPTSVFATREPVFGPGWQQFDDTKSWSIFGHGTYRLTDRLSLTGGMRYTEDDKFSAGRTLQRNDTWSAVTGRAGFEYRWTDDVMTYISAARGYKSGGVNSVGTGVGVGSSFSPFDPEFVWTYEVGVKSDLLGRRLRFNTAAFYSDYSDIQFRQRLPTIVFVGNAAKAEIKGFEMELTAVPTRALALNLSVGYVDAQYTEVDAGSPITTGAEFVETPEWSVSVGGEYSMLINDQSNLTARVDYAYKSEIQHDLGNNPLVAQEPYSLVNARLSYEYIPGNWSVSLFGTNLTDEHYSLNGIDFTGSVGWAIAQYARPREWGISLRKSF